MKTAYLFPGQGSQFVGMGQGLHVREPEVRALFAKADLALGYALSDLCFNGPIGSLTATEAQQPANFVVGMARWLTVQRSHDWPRADFVVGQSMGMITALAAVGAIGFEDGLHLAQQRGLLMKEAGEQQAGAMAAVLGLSAETVTNLCTQIQAESGLVLQLANDNSPVHHNISGDVAALDMAVPRLKAIGARKVVRLPISIASHCELMRGMAEKYAKVVASIAFRDAAVPLVSNVSAEPIQTAAELQHEIVAHLTAPVRWRESMITLRRLGVTTFIDIGPGDSLSKLMKRIDRSASRRTFE